MLVASVLIPFSFPSDPSPHSILVISFHLTLQTQVHIRYRRFHFTSPYRPRSTFDLDDPPLTRTSVQCPLLRSRSLPHAKSRLLSPGEREVCEFQQLGSKTPTARAKPPGCPLPQVLALKPEKWPPNRRLRHLQLT